MTDVGLKFKCLTQLAARTHPPPHPRPLPQSLPLGSRIAGRGGGGGGSLQTTGDTPVPRRRGKYSFIPLSRLLSQHVHEVVTAGKLEGHRFHVKLSDDSSPNLDT